MKGPVLGVGSVGSVGRVGSLGGVGGVGSLGKDGERWAKGRGKGTTEGLHKDSIFRVLGGAPDLRYSVC